MYNLVQFFDTIQNLVYSLGLCSGQYIFFLTLSKTVIVLVGIFLSK